MKNIRQFNRQRLILWGVIFFFSLKAWSWATGGSIDIIFFHVHRNIARKVLVHKDIRWALSYFNLKLWQVTHYAAIEPTHYLGWHPDYWDLEDQSYLDWGEPDEKIIGAILHVAGDSGVASCHSPAGEVFCDQKAELLFEGSGESRLVTSLTDVYTGSWPERMNQFYSEQIAIAQEYKDWFYQNWLCQWFCNPWSWAKKGEKTALRLGHTVLLQYFCEYADYQPIECDLLFE